MLSSLWKRKTPAQVFDDELARAKTFREAGDHHRADAHLARARQVANDSPDLLLLLAGALAGASKKDEALACLRGLAKFKSEDATVQYKVAVASRDIGNIDLAIESLQAALKLDPGHIETLSAFSALTAPLIQADKVDWAVQAMRCTLVLQPDSIGTWTTLGGFLSHHGRNDEALKCLQRAAELKPDNVIAHYGVGVISRALGQLELAETAFQRVLQLNPNHAEALQGLTDIAANPDRGTIAITETENSVSLAARLARALLSEARTEDNRRTGGLNGHFAISRLRVAHPIYDRLIAQILFQKGVLAHKLGLILRLRGNYTRTLGLAADGDGPERLLENGGVTADLSEAERLYRATLEFDPALGQAHYNLATILAGRGQHDDAIARLDTAAKLDAHLRPFVDLSMGAIHSTMGHRSEAAECYRSATRNLTKLGRTHALVARAYRQVGDWDEALRHYKDALSWTWFYRPEFSVLGGKFTDEGRTYLRTMTPSAVDGVSTHS